MLPWDLYVLMPDQTATLTDIWGLIEELSNGKCRLSSGGVEELQCCKKCSRIERTVSVSALGCISICRCFYSSYVEQTRQKSKMYALSTCYAAVLSSPFVITLFFICFSGLLHWFFWENCSTGWWFFAQSCLRTWASTALERSLFFVLSFWNSFPLQNQG